MTKKLLLKYVRHVLKPLNPQLVEFIKYKKKSRMLGIKVVSAKFKNKNNTLRLNKLWKILSKPKRMKKYLFIFEALTPGEYEQKINLSAN